MTRGESQDGGMLKRADPKTIQDKVLVGYQGWFTCAGDGEPIHPGHHGWLHWFHNLIPNGGRPNTDLWPDVSEYDPSELYLAPGLTSQSGDPVYLFSSRQPKTVQRHFHWMALHGVDGAFLQRFAGQCEITHGRLGVRNLRDEVGQRVREAAEAEGRVFAIMYDVSGVAPDRIQGVLEKDWIHLLRDQHILDSPNYLHENERPVVALWGFGLDKRKHTPELVRAITDFFRSSTPGGVYLIAGTAGHWRTATSDADRNPELIQVWTDCFDAISPWTVGRYNDEEGADRWGEDRVKADADYLRKLEAEGGRKVDYMPVVLPGGSGFNLSEGKWGMNDMKRNGGRFLWRQIYNARRAGVRTIYGAMWDEYDEGTAFMPVVSHSSQLPVHPSFRFVALDIDGYDLPSDWYMRIVGYAAEAFHGERTLPDTLPLKELEDYWSTRPHRERIEEGDSSVDEVTRAFGAWEVPGGNVNENVPSEAPPPYSLEDASRQRKHVPGGSSKGGGRGGRPPVSLETRPSPVQASLLPAAAAAAGGAAVVAHTVSGGSTSPSSATLNHGRAPPPVHMSTHPSPRVLPPSPGEIVMSPPIPPRPATAYDDEKHPHRHSHSGHVSSSSVGHMASHHSHNALPNPHPGLDARLAFPLPGAVSHLALDEHARGRPGSGSGSSSEFREHASAAGRPPQVHASRPAVPVQSHPAHGPGHGHGYSVSQNVHGHAHAHSLSPVGTPSPHTAAFPGAGAGMVYTQSEGGVHGPVGYGHSQTPYVPAHSHPVGHGGPGYAPDPPGAYAPTAGYGYGHGPGYPQQQQQGYGYVSHPSSPQYYAPYGGTGTGGTNAGYVGRPSSGSIGSGSGSGSGQGSGSGRGGMASALQVVEHVAGRSTREQVERTVKSLANTGTSLFHKFK